MARKEANAMRFRKILRDLAISLLGSLMAALILQTLAM